MNKFDWFKIFYGSEVWGIYDKDDFTKRRTIRKVMGGGEGNFRAAGIFFRYQTPCINFYLGQSINIF